MLREEAIKKHRTMWNWIAEQIVTNERTMSIPQLKAKYIGTREVERKEIHKHNNCYLCYFTDIICTKCPLLWPSDASSFQCEAGWILPDGDIDNGLYSRCLDLYRTDKWKLQAYLAYEIANLPERKKSK